MANATVHTCSNANCDYTTKDVTEITTHIAQSSSDKTVWECQGCYKKFCNRWVMTKPGGHLDTCRPFKHFRADRKYGRNMDTNSRLEQMSRWTLDRLMGKTSAEPEVGWSKHALKVTTENEAENHDEKKPKPKNSAAQSQQQVTPAKQRAPSKRKAEDEGEQGDKDDGPITRSMRTRKPTAISKPPSRQKRVKLTMEQEQESEDDAEFEAANNTAPTRKVRTILKPQSASKGRKVVHKGEGELKKSFDGSTFHEYATMPIGTRAVQDQPLNRKRKIGNDEEVDSNGDEARLVKKKRAAHTHNRLPATSTPGLTSEVSGSPSKKSNAQPRKPSAPSQTSNRRRELSKPSASQSQLQSGSGTEENAYGNGWVGDFAAHILEDNQHLVRILEARHQVLKKKRVLVKIAKIEKARMEKAAMKKAKMEEAESDRLNRYRIAIPEEEATTSPTAPTWNDYNAMDDEDDNEPVSLSANDYDMPLFDEGEDDMKQFGVSNADVWEDAKGFLWDLGLGDWDLGIGPWAQ